MNSARLRELAKDFANGRLPEQSEPPKTRWCSGCRTPLGKQSEAKDKVLTRFCNKCGGTAMVRDGR